MQLVAKGVTLLKICPHRQIWQTYILARETASEVTDT